MTTKGTRVLSCRITNVEYDEFVRLAKEAGYEYPGEYLKLMIRGVVPQVIDFAQSQERGSAELSSQLNGVKLAIVEGVLHNIMRHEKVTHERAIQIYADRIIEWNAAAKDISRRVQEAWAVDNNVVGSQN